MHSDGMSDSGQGGGYVWYPTHDRGGSARTARTREHRSGPYRNAAAAGQAGGTRARYGAQPHVEDVRWTGERP